MLLTSVDYPKFYVLQDDDLRYLQYLVGSFVLQIVLPHEVIDIETTLICMTSLLFSIKLAISFSMNASYLNFPLKIQKTFSAVDKIIYHRTTKITDFEVSFTIHTFLLRIIIKQYMKREA